MKDFCDYHMMPHPCEMCNPTKCLTHRKPLPCNSCNPEQVVKSDGFGLAGLPEDCGKESAEREQALYQRIENLEKAVVEILALVKGKADQSQVNSLQTQITQLSGEVTVLRSL